MQEVLTAVAILVLFCLSAVAGRCLQRLMPDMERARETIETMRLVIGMLVTFAALVLGTLTASVRNGYDAARRDRQAYALQLTLLDHCLRDYGADAKPIRDDLARYTAAVIASTWPREAPPVGLEYPDTRTMPVIGASPVLGEIMSRIGRQIRALTPATPVAAVTAEDCRQAYRDVSVARLTVIEDAGTTLSAPFFWILIFWLIIVFLTLGLAAPRNKIATLGILLCAVSLSSAVFVVTDLSRPYRGLMSISSADMRATLAQMLSAP